jgi:hypothetical protein
MSIDVSIVGEVLKFLIKLASIPLGWLPDHTPIAWPDMGFVSYVFSFIGLAGEFMHLPVLFLVIGLELAFMAAFFLYAVWRALLGLIPALK